MAFAFLKFLKGINIVPVSSSSVSEEGDLEVLDSSGKLNYHNGTTASPVVTEAHAATLTNKTIDADLNSISNIENADIKVGADIARAKLADGTANHVLINDPSGVMSSEAALSPTRGGTGVSNNAAATLTRSGNHALTLTMTAPTNVTLPTTGTLATLAGTEEFTNKDIDGGTAANDHRITLPKNTSTNLDALTRKEGTVVYDTTNGVVKYDNGVTLNALSGTNLSDSSQDLQNLALSISVAANALTIAAVTKAGTDASAGSPIRMAFRSSTASSGLYNIRNVTAALSMVVSAGSTLGTADGASNYLYVYALDNAGTVELAVSMSYFDEGVVQSTTAEGGVGGADSNSVMYSTTARSNVPVRLIGRFLASQTTAGTWASSPTEVSLVPFELKDVSAAPYRATTSQTLTAGATTEVVFNTKRFDTTNSFTTANGRFTAPRSGRYDVDANVTLGTGAGAPTAVEFFFRVNGAGAELGRWRQTVFAINSDYAVNLSATIFLNAGDYVSLFGTPTTNNVTVRETGGVNDVSAMYVVKVGSF